MAEDFAVAYGFDRLRDDMHLPSTSTIGQEYELNYLSDKMRLLLSQNNYIEVATFSLCSKVIFVLWLPFSRIQTLSKLSEGWYVFTWNNFWNLKQKKCLVGLMSVNEFIVKLERLDS